MALRERNDLEPLEPLPAVFINAQQEFIGAAAINFGVRVKPGATNVLQVPAGPLNARAAIAIQGRWRWVEANVERVDIGGAARTLDVYVTAAESVYVAGSPGEVDNTDRAFALALVEHDAAAPAGVDLTRKVAEAVWDGTAFTSVAPMVGGQPDSRFDLTLANRAGTYAARPPASAALNGLRYYATDKAMEFQCIAGAWALVSAVPVEVTALPASPVDGQEVTYDPPGNTGSIANQRVRWRLRYDASDNVWHCLGGSALEAGGSTPLTTAGGWDVISSGLTIPALGFWDLEFGAELGQTTAGASAQFGWANGGAAVPPSGPMLLTFKVAGDQTTSLARRVGSSFTVAGDIAAAFTPRMAASGGGTTRLDHWWLRAKPQWLLPV